MITHGELKALLDYDETTGIFTWRISPRYRINIGDTAGCVNNKGYIHIQISGVKYLAHRLAWLYTFGGLPDPALDHINGDKQDNRICNLRLATNAENCRNRGANRNNKTGFKGVCKVKGLNKWVAQCTDGSNRTYLGCYNSPQEAHAAYNMAATIRFGVFHHG
jgi:hypothetical protein